MFSRLIKRQRGFTLIEILAVLAISGLIGLGATVVTSQVFTQSAKDSDYTTVSRNAMNAIYWVSRDAQMSQAVVPGGDYGFPLILSWTEWDNSTHQVTYSIEDDTLSRSYVINGGGPNQTVVAQCINSVAANTTCEFAEGVLSLQMTSTIGEGEHALSVTRVREISPRPSL